MEIISRIYPHKPWFENVIFGYTDFKTEDYFFVTNLFLLLAKYYIHESQFSWSKPSNTVFMITVKNYNWNNLYFFIHFLYTKCLFSHTFLFIVFLIIYLIICVICLMPSLLKCYAYALNKVYIKKILPFNSQMTHQSTIIFITPKQTKIPHLQKNV